MEITKHVCFSAQKAPELLDYLHKYNIPYKSTGNLLTMDILESDPNWPYIQSCVLQQGLVCVSESIFSPKELQEAQWLCVRSKWRCGYPQPEGRFAYRDLTYAPDSYCQACKSGLVQKEAFRIKTSPKWGKRHFMMLNWVGDELFLDSTAKRILEKAAFSGISYSAVKNPKGNSAYEDVYQLVIPTFQENSFVANSLTVREVNVCPCCGVPKYHPTGVGMYTFRRHAFVNAPDMVKTKEIFGWGGAADHLILVRQKVYRAVLDNHLEQGLVFTPITLV